jgi:Flp pilus assembly protein TadG
VRHVRADDRGQAVVWVAVLLPLLLSVVGLAAEGGLVFGARLELQNVADGAARAGATQIDVQRYRESAGTTVALDVPRARRAAAEYLAARRAGVSATVEADPTRVVVRATQEVPTGFLRLAGLHTVRIATVAQAEVRFGVERGDR